MDDIAFEAIDKTKRKIYLSISPHKFDDSMRNYYRYHKNEKLYLLVSVKHLNGESFVATVFYTTSIKKK